MCFTFRGYSQVLILKKRVLVSKLPLQCMACIPYVCYFWTLNWPLLSARSILMGDHFTVGSRWKWWNPSIGMRYEGGYLHSYWKIVQLNCSTAIEKSYFSSACGLRSFLSSLYQRKRCIVKKWLLEVYHWFKEEVALFVPRKNWEESKYLGKVRVARNGIPHLFGMIVSKMLR